MVRCAPGAHAGLYENGMEIRMKPDRDEKKIGPVPNGHERANRPPPAIQIPPNPPLRKGGRGDFHGKWSRGHHDPSFMQSPATRLPSLRAFSMVLSSGAPTQATP